jgi:hypothetical protein
MIPELGIIEGFFGKHGAGKSVARWSALFSRMATASICMRPGRRFPAASLAGAPSGDELGEIASFAAFCRERGVRFGIGLSPFELHAAPGEEWRGILRAKWTAWPRSVSTISPSVR